MQKIKISTDSTADIPVQLREELNIKVIPLTIICGEKQYRDGYDLTPEEFLQTDFTQTDAPEEDTAPQMGGIQS